MPNVAYFELIGLLLSVGCSIRSNLKLKLYFQHLHRHKSRHDKLFYSMEFE